MKVNKKVKEASKMTSYLCHESNFGECQANACMICEKSIKWKLSSVRADFMVIEWVWSLLCWRTNKRKKIHKKGRCKWKIKTKPCSAQAKADLRAKVIHVWRVRVYACVTLTCTQTASRFDHHQQLLISSTLTWCKFIQTCKTMQTQCSICNNTLKGNLLIFFFVDSFDFQLHN